jgi:hypothetical protein
MCMIQASFADCAAVGTSHRDNPTDTVSLVGEIIDKPWCTYPWYGRTFSNIQKRQPVIVL